MRAAGNESFTTILNGQDVLSIDDVRPMSNQLDVF